MNPADCGPEAPHAPDDPPRIGIEPVDTTVAVTTAVVGVALDAEHLQQVRDCRDRAAHDQDAAALQQQRAAALNESTPALVQRIQAAARAKDCHTVHALEGSLDDRDPAQHDQVYGHDPDVLRCAGR